MQRSKSSRLLTYEDGLTDEKPGVPEHVFLVPIDDEPLGITDPLRQWWLSNLRQPEMFRFLPMANDPTRCDLRNIFDAIFFTTILICLVFWIIFILVIFNVGVFNCEHFLPFCAFNPD